MNIKRIPETQGWLQRIGEWAVRQHTFMPRMVDFEISRVCNLSCPACMRRADSSLAQSRKELPYATVDTFKAILEEIPTIGTLNFMGDGEPFMNPQVGDIIHYASLKNIHTVITTNATLINKHMVEQWKRDKVYRVHASVDAIEKLYEEVRVGAEWGKTYESLKLVGQSGIPFCINAVLTKKTTPHMLDIVKLAKDVGAKEVTYLMPICTYGDDREIKPEASNENFLLFEETRSLCRKLGINWIFPLTLHPTFRRFSFPFIRPQISIEGDIFACCYSLGRGRVWYEGYAYDVPDYNMGNMFREGFQNVWHNEGYKEIRKIYKESEVPKGTIISRQELLRRTKFEMEDGHGEKYAHCRICLARWGMACS